MNSKTVFNTIATVFFVTVFVTSVPNAYADACVLPVTAGDGDIRPDQMPVIEQPETVPIVSPLLADQIDQNQPSGPTYMAAFNQTDLAQSFMQTNTNISGAGIFLQSGVGTSDNVIIQLWDNLPASGTMLATGSATGVAGEWVDVYWSYVPVTPGTTYYLVFLGNTTLGITGDTNNPYPNGHVYANSGFTPFPNYDYAFRTYYDDDVSLERHTWANVKSFFN